MTDDEYEALAGRYPQFGRALLEGFVESARRGLSSGSLRTWAQFKEGERIRCDARLHMARSRGDREEWTSAVRWARVSRRIMGALEEEFRIVPAERGD